MLRHINIVPFANITLSVAEQNNPKKLWPIKFTGIWKYL
jgi:hypothetical protein